MFKLNNNIQLEQLIPYMLLKNNTNLINSDISDNNNHYHSSSNKLENKETKYSAVYCKFNNKYNGSIYKKSINLDALFWCFYELYTANTDLNLTLDNINSNNKNFEVNFKLEFVQKLRDNKSIIKQNKLKITQLEDEFTNQKYITLGGFIALCVIYNISCIIINSNNTYYKINVLEDQTISTIHIVEKHNKSYDIKYSKDYDIATIFSNYYYIENYDRVLKGMSSYKLECLQNIAIKLSIDLYKCEKQTKKKTKTELYQEIYNRLL